MAGRIPTGGLPTSAGSPRCGSVHGTGQRRGATGFPGHQHPKVVLAPGARLPLYETLVTVAVPPLVVSEPLHTWLMVCPDPIVQLTRQPVVTVEPLLDTATSAWKPPGQLLVTR